VADRFLDWIAGLPSAAVYVVLMVMSAIENVFPPVPADVAVVLGAFLAHRGVTSAPLLGLLCWIANTVSSAAVYFYARSKGRALVEKGWARALMPPEAMDAIAEAYARHGMLGIFVSRFLPGVRAAVTPFAGVVGMSPARALIPASSASAIWYALLVAFGNMLGLNWEDAKAMVGDLNRVLGLLSAVVVVAVVAWLWRRVRRGAAEAAAGDPPR